ncbi:MAG: S8 family serine peptidase [Clostridiales bacterium]|nr:S8 family serine peptidase [Clostridiales bacterium]
MNDQKIENQLNLALEATQEEREKSPDLETGYDPVERTWEIIVKYSGSLGQIVPEAVRVTELLNEYAILIVPESLLEAVAQIPEIEYIEKPRRLYFARTEGMRASCVTPVRRPPFSLTGKGVLVAVLDSGADYRHPEFRRGDGRTRIRNLWDQTVSGRAPDGYHLGTEFTEEELNASLDAGGEPPVSRDVSGHGTGVLAIAAGTGGMAYESDLLVVKLGNPAEGGFPRTTELMQGLDYVIRKALEYRMPVAVNISFGNTYGSHTGTSLLERYMDDMSNLWKSVICVGSGNEGAAAGHAGGQLRNREIQNVEFATGPYEPSLSLQIWKNYVDTFEVSIVHPNGTVIGPFLERPTVQRYQAGRTELLVYYGEPSPYSAQQEIYVEFIPSGDYMDNGIWNIRLVPVKIIDGIYQMWFPGYEAIGGATRFLRPTENNTLTIPSTAFRVITVGAYNTVTDAYADFSGRGSADNGSQKPTLVAPGVNILTAAPNGGYIRQTGTSFAAPFVTGAAALLMQYGITDGNDPYLYGEKVKAFLRRGAQPLPAFREYPNPVVGYGKLCVEKSLPV